MIKFLSILFIFLCFNYSVNLCKFVLCKQTVRTDCMDNTNILDINKLALTLMWSVGAWNFLSDHSLKLKLKFMKFSYSDAYT